MKYFLLLGVFICLSAPLKAQNSQCGNDLTQLSPAELKKATAFFEQNRPPISKTNATDSVAITIHIVETIPGAANITYADIEREISRASLAYARAGITFFICGSPRYVRGAEIYNFSSGDVLHRSNGVSNTIDIYFVDDLESNSSQALCGYAQFPWVGKPDDRYIMMNKGCSTDGATLTHELGHFYGLLHTHETAYGREYVDGSNCGSAGDRLCDTGADPNLSNPGMLSGCLYIGNYVDPKGDPYNPPVSNYMSYAGSSCQNGFSKEQIDVIRSIHENENAYLASNCDFYPDFAVAPNVQQLTIRSDQDITLDYTFQNLGINQEYEVDLNVTLGEDPNDTKFILVKDKIMISPGQTSFSKTYDIDFPIARSTGTYYINAFIDSEYRIIERTESNNYATTTIKVDNSSLENVVLFPNPVQDELKMFFRDKKSSGKMFIRVYRYDGRLVLEDEAFKNAEEFFRIIDVSWLTTGLYVITVDFEKVNSEYSFKFLKK
jgi:hypothetical protein